MPIALTRAVPPSISRCELTHREREPIDVALAVEQHDDYERALADLGCRVVPVEAAPELPDSVFIEDTAVILHDLAIIARPGAKSRRAETAAVARALRDYLPLADIEAPATIDGGDVLRAGKRLFVGLSSRTNDEALTQLQRIARGYQVVGVDVRGILHLKSAVTVVGPDALLINRAFVDDAPFRDFDLIDADDANALLIGDVAIVSSEATERALRSRGIATRLVPNGELAKAEGGVTCCSLIV